ncbi:ABC transporter ATP-binding protein [Alteriqipengyuania lutimaris]|uniref:ABC transporter ATP-binding protein n=1 Tax=Alteriqipengyuania lutimaris TaxID=1538146 RepID=A0A395LP29_9SPHN|nr:ABC transporter ATP-binding protein [Alteriqipengyuania lutimaris]MBB3033720.1 iron(III) transport system ATP-binding protein [Alteriqipengyuania lutimaris]RDS77294.1 ABC transporter ATP-binding protein [Alteriqipengyuania lutimaris]
MTPHAEAGHDEAHGAAILTVRGASVRFGDTHALRSADLDLHPGRITAILGPSGAGKSTMLRAIAGFQRLTHGVIAMDGTTLTDGARMTPAERRGIGMVVQDLALFPHLNAWRNIAFGLRGADMRTTALEWLARLGLEHRADAYPHELSGGEQQRVALARALAPGPAVVLLDEAFSSLDPQLRRGLRRETEALLRQSGAAVLMVTHDPDEAMEMADDLVVMAAGEVLQQGAPQTVYWSPDNALVGSLLGEINVLQGRVEGGLLRTEFGAIAAPGLPEGQRIEALVRPCVVSAMAATADTRLRVVRSTFRGSDTMLAIENPKGERIVALLPGGEDLAKGQAVEVTFDSGRITFVEHR